MMRQTAWRRCMIPHVLLLDQRIEIRDEKTKQFHLYYKAAPETPPIVTCGT